ncbi:MAG: thioredoxin family protein [Candidatus Coatesbacteria bacterium]|nr:thioredoxin family protein [Candidatus Coatesbacteria bacterium]
MKRLNIGAKIIVIVVLLTGVAGAIYLRERGLRASGVSGTNSENTAPVENPKTRLPRLVDLGAGKCIPCKMMAPILEELQKEYKGKFEVIVIDVWKDQSAGQRYGIRLIPTQIFYDATGTELFRHQGFYSKEDILAKWKELGVDLQEAE